MIQCPNCGDRHPVEITERGSGIKYLCNWCGCVFTMPDSDPPCLVIVYHNPMPERARPGTEPIVLRDGEPATIRLPRWISARNLDFD